MVIKNLATGTSGSMKNISKKYFLRINIPLPPLKEQKKIAQILSTWDRAIEKQEALIKAKERLKKGLMQKLLTGNVRFKGFSEEWEEVRLGDIGEIIRGVSYKPNNLFDKDNKNTIRLLRSINIEQNFLNINTKLQYVDKDKVTKSQILQNGDLVICMANGSKNLVGKNAEYIFNNQYSYTVGAFCAY